LEEKMNRDKSYIIFKIAVVLLFSIFFSVQGFALIEGNGSGGAYGDSANGDSTGKRLADAYNIENIVIEVAGYSLKAKASLNKMLYIVETQGVAVLSGDEFAFELDNTIQAMKEAVSTYYSLIRVAEVTPYNPVVIKKLQNFDYYGYYWRNDLNYSIFRVVSNYLRIGNVTGIYRRSKEKMQNILDLLVFFRDELGEERQVKMSDLRKVNEKMSEEAIFGSYIAGVFEAIN
jgi:hypothetical protein